LAGAFLFAALRLESPRPLQWMVYLFLGLGGAFVFAALVPSLRPLAIGIYQRAVLDATFWTWLVALGLGQALLNRDLPRHWRIACVVVVLAAFYFMIIDRQSWTSGWLPALVAIVTILATRRPKWLMIGGAVVLLGAIVAPGWFQNVLMGGDNAYSLETRLAGWEILLRMVRVNPILGLGPANYYNYTPLFPILGYPVSFNSHNNYMDLLVQVGLAGLGCFLWFAATLGRFLWRVRDQLPEGFARSYADSALAGFAGILVAGLLGDWVIPFVYNVGLEGLRAGILGWMFLGAAVALGRLASERPPAPPALVRKAA
jgi:O-antigen ligase